VDLRERLEADLKQAMKSGDTLRRETIRGVRGAVRNREIEVGGTLDEDGILRVIRALVKQRTEAIEQFRAGGRDDLVRKESAEREVLDGYLPARPDAAAVERVVREVIAEVGAAGPRDVGRVMRPALERLGAAVDGKLVNETARRLLAGG
jgi:uncharacterized protein YqeY